MSGRKDDAAKLRYDLMPYAALEDEVAVLTFGAAKYAANNWQQVPDGINRYFAAAMRHLIAYRQGEKLDKESGFSHLSHARCCIAFIYWLEKQQEANLSHAMEFDNGWCDWDDSELCHGFSSDTCA